MLKSPFFRRLFLPQLALICIAISIVGVLAGRSLRDSYLQRTRSAMRDDGWLIARLVSDNVQAGRMIQLNEQVRDLGHTISCRITIVTDDGMVIADNEADAAAMGNHHHRPEIITASEHTEGWSLRHSNTIDQSMLYFALRVKTAEAPPYYIRLALPLDALGRHLEKLYFKLTTAALLAAVACGAICYYVARRHAVPLVLLTHFADGLARGELNRRVMPIESGEGEMETLATALNSMADSLSQLIAQTRRDNAELLAILSSMSEGVIAIDTRQSILLVNAAAADLLDFAVSQAQGRLLWELVRDNTIVQAAVDVLTTGRNTRFQAGPINGKHLEVAISAFGQEPSLQGQPPLGAVIVVHDTTQSVRYQELRKEFVANVSHELRTPLTAIKGFSQTLRDGAMNDPVKGPQYLATIEKHADQLTNLVSDLLELSRLENRPGLPRHISVNLDDTIKRAIRLLSPLADKKGQSLTVHCSGNPVIAMGDPDYLERAIANLVENAVKYTPQGGKITISLSADTLQATVKVSDNGVGIPKKDLPRIFERFYRVDRSRSREMGGTGLGLSIVKHIAQAHGGSVEVSSEEGRGSHFSLKLPLDNAKDSA